MVNRIKIIVTERGYVGVVDGPSVRNWILLGSKKNVERYLNGEVRAIALNTVENKNFEQGFPMDDDIPIDTTIFLSEDRYNKDMLRYFNSELGITVKCPKEDFVKSISGEIDSFLMEYDR